MNEYNDLVLPAQHDLEPNVPDAAATAKKRALVFMALINVAVVIALGSLTIWHAILIRKGESSIEAHINSSETKRLATQGKMYVNPYDFGPKRNFQIFLGLTNGR